MKLAAFTVNRPVLTTMVTLIVMILGVLSLWRLPIDLMPDITYPTLSVTTTYANASPEEIEELVTRPVEEALSAVPGVEEVTSSSSEGMSNVRISLTWGTDLDAAANDVRDRLDRVVSRLPDDADKPQLRKFDLASFPVLILGASSDLDPLQMRKLIEDQVKYRIERVPGVASLDIMGGLEREIHVDLDLGRVRAYGLALNQVFDRIRAGNVDRPAGTIRHDHLDLRIRVPGYYQDLEELRETTILERDGVPVRLRDIADIRDTWQKEVQRVRVNGVPGVRLSINKQSGTNTVTVAEAAMAEIARINRDLPQMRIVAIIDSAQYIRNSIRNTGTAAVYGGFLAILVLLFFLRDIRATTVIAVAIPVSIVATFAMMYFNGYTLNLMTLGGLALGIGMLVDNAIVVLENVARIKRDDRLSPHRAAIVGAEEVTAPVVASTLTTLVVFLPMIFMQGMSGIMFKQLSMVIGFSLLCSLVAAVTLVPMLAAKLLRAETDTPPPDERSRSRRLAAWSEARFRALESGYSDLLHWTLSHRIVVIAGTLLLLGATAALVPFIGTELMPASDEGEVRVDGEMETGASMETVDRQFLAIEEIVRREIPELKNMVVSLGGSAWRASGSHTGNSRISLVPLRERRRSSEDIANTLRKKLSGIPGMILRIRANQGLFIMRMGSDEARASVDIRGHDFAAGDALAAAVQKIMADIDGVTDVRISRAAGAPERRIRIDRGKADDLGLTVDDIAQALETVLGGTNAGEFRDGGDEYSILVKATQAEHLPLDEILDLNIVNRRGEPIILRNVVHAESATGPVIVERKNQERVVTVSGNLDGKRDLGSIIGELGERLQPVAIPPGMSIVFTGDYEDQQKSFRELLISLALAILLVYMVMACQFESLRDPFVVMFSVPLAAVGVVLVLFLTRTTFNLQSYIGCIMLAGIVVNNAILLVDHTNLLRRRDGLPLREAIEEAGRRRLRPILMTSLTTCLGLLPLAMGWGEGGEAQAPMARAVIGGLASASLITLLLVPIVYSLFEQHLAKPKITAD
jgi:HAE1 family hydrophobic/amphiphilic exporter-1